MQYDETVRESSGNIVEFRYGGDNCDAAFLDKVTLHFLTMTKDQLAGEFDSEELPIMVALIRECIAAKVTLLSTQLSVDAHIPVNIVSILAQL